MLLRLVPLWTLLYIVGLESDSDSPNFPEKLLTNLTDDSFNRIRSVTRTEFKKNQFKNKSTEETNRAVMLPSVQKVGNELSTIWKNETLCPYQIDTRYIDLIFAKVAILYAAIYEREKNLIMCLPAVQCLQLHSQSPTLRWKLIGCVAKTG